MGTDPFGWVGQVLGGKYRVDEFVGEGGFAVVYRGFHEALRVAVALKCLKLGSSVVGPRREMFLERFLLEGQLLHRLSRGSAAIAQALDVGVAVSPSGQVVPYLVLEWLEGRSLAADFEERARSGLGPRALLEAIECLEPAAEALDYAHGQGVAHRDIKPDNLFLAFVGGAVTLKVLDFGIAKVVEDAAAMTPGAGSVTLDGRPFTPGYAAPEQLNPNLGSTGPWTDVYALALVLLETVSGRKAILGASNLELHQRALDLEHRPSFASMGMKVPDAVEDVVARALAVDPRNRYRRAGELWRALRAATNQAPREPAAAEAPSARFSRTHTEEAAAPSPRTAETNDAAAEQARRGRPPIGTLPAEAAPPPQRRAAGKRWPLAASGAALLLAVGLGALLVHRWTPESGDSISSTVLEPEGTEPLRSPGVVSSPAARIRIQGGTFIMGSDDREVDEAPAHRVTISPFRIGRTEVSVSDFLRCYHAGGCDLPATDGRCAGSTSNSDHPVVCVDWDNARRYCEWDGGRLPTEAEWEFAARGIEQREYPWGTGPPECTHADFDDGTGSCLGAGPSRVGLHPAGATPTGVFDLAGNVWEWVSDWYGPYAANPATNPEGPQVGHERVARGGTWGSPGTELRAAKRWKLGPQMTRPGVGFRCAYPAGDTDS